MQPKMKIEIKVTATECTEEEMRRSKMFAAGFEDKNGKYFAKQGSMTEVEDRLIEAIASRIRLDRDTLIEWSNLPGFVGAKIKIIPAIDYQPQNQ